MLIRPAVVISFLLMELLLCADIHSTEIKLDDIYVEGSLSSIENIGGVYVLPMEGNDSYKDIFKGISSVDIRNYGASGVKSNVSVLGSGPDRVLITLDGIPMNDPQTAHFNLDIPVPFSALSRVEAISGIGSVNNGSNAMGGVINLVPLSFSEKKNIYIKTGSYNSSETSCTLAKKGEKYSNVSSLYWKKTGAYHDQTDSLQTILFEKLSSETFSLYLGYLNKEYGAYDFYTPNSGYPSREWKEGFVSAYSFKKDLFDYNLEHDLSWRRMWNKYQLNAYKPYLYQNVHTNDSIRASLKLSRYNFRFGLETVHDYMDSSSMGYHYINTLSVFSEYVYIYRNAILSLGWRYDDYLLPRIACSYRINRSVKLFSGVGLSYRRPNFTELFYNSPVNKGNPALDNEKLKNLELGLDIKAKKHMSLRLLYTAKQYTNMIDWVGKTRTGPWQTENIGSNLVQNAGCETVFQKSLVFFRAGYVYTDMDKNSSYISKYSLKYSPHRLSFDLKIGPVKKYFIKLDSESALFENREISEYSKWNLGVEKKLKYCGLELQVNDIFSSGYSDVDGIPVPGRWVWLGLNFN